MIQVLEKNKPPKHFHTWGRYLPSPLPGSLSAPFLLPVVTAGDIQSRCGSSSCRQEGCTCSVMDESSTGSAFHGRGPFKKCIFHHRASLHPPPLNCCTDWSNVGPPSPECPSPALDTILQAQDDAGWRKSQQISSPAICPKQHEP